MGNNRNESPQPNVYYENISRLVDNTLLNANSLLEKLKPAAEESTSTSRSTRRTWMGSDISSGVPMSGSVSTSSSSGDGYTCRAVQPPRMESESASSGSTGSATVPVMQSGSRPIKLAFPPKTSLYKRMSETNTAYWKSDSSSSKTGRASDPKSSYYSKDDKRRPVTVVHVKNIYIKCRHRDGQKICDKFKPQVPDSQRKTSPYSSTSRTSRKTTTKSQKPADTAAKSDSGRSTSDDARSDSRRENKGGGEKMGAIPVTKHDSRRTTSDDARSDVRRENKGGGGKMREIPSMKSGNKRSTSDDARSDVRRDDKGGGEKMCPPNMHPARSNKIYSLDVRPARSSSVQRSSPRRSDSKQLRAASPSVRTARCATPAGIPVSPPADPRLHTPKKSKVSSIRWKSGSKVQTVTTGTKPATTDNSNNPDVVGERCSSDVRTARGTSVRKSSPQQFEAKQSWCSSEVRTARCSSVQKSSPQQFDAKQLCATKPDVLKFDATVRVKEGNERVHQLIMQAELLGKKVTQLFLNGRECRV
ncbi:hypothetical protein Q1695_008692 [Nippostrongylus brasiliensis]|nr:hypothetical protein Q1695_008692 [Nippostrongylus brasiliensis]